MKRILCLILMLATPARAQSVDAGSWAKTGTIDGPQVLAVLDAVVTVELSDGGQGPTVPVIGGCWLSESFCIGYARELNGKRKQVAHLEAHAADAPTAWLLGAFSLGLALGAAGATAVFCATNNCNPFK